MRHGTWVETGNGSEGAGLGLAAAIALAFWLAHLAGVAQHPDAHKSVPVPALTGAHVQATAHAVNVGPGVGWWAMAAATLLACAVALLIVVAALWPVLRRLRRPARHLPPTLAVPERVPGDDGSVIVLADYTSRHRPAPDTPGHPTPPAPVKENTR